MPDSLDQLSEAHEGHKPRETVESAISHEREAAQERAISMLDPLGKSALEARKALLSDQVHTLLGARPLPKRTQTWIQRHHAQLPNLASVTVAYGHPIEQWTEEEEDRIEWLVHHLHVLQPYIPEWKGIKLSKGHLLLLLRFAADLEHDPSARDFTEVLARLYTIRGVEAGMPHDPLPFFDDHTEKPYVDLASGPSALNHLAWLHTQGTPRRPVFFNDTAFFTQTNIGELRTLYGMQQTECEILTDNAQSAIVRFEPGSIGTVRMHDAGPWLQGDDEHWYGELMDRVSPDHGRIVVSMEIPYEKGVETFEWADLEHLDDEMLKRIALSSNASVHWGTQLMMHIRQASSSANNAQWIMQAGTLNREGLFHPNERLMEEDSWTLACVFTRLS